MLLFVFMLLSMTSSISIAKYIMVIYGVDAGIVSAVICTSFFVGLSHILNSNIKGFISEVIDYKSKDSR